MTDAAFIVLPRLDLNDLDSGTLIRIFVRVAPGSIPCFFGFEHGGDIEIEPGLEDCQRIVDLLKRVLDMNTNRTQMPKRAMRCEFKNLDGGARATWTVSRQTESVEITLKRSDEGDFIFRLSSSDTKKLQNTLEDGLSRCVSGEFVPGSTPRP